MLDKEVTVQEAMRVLSHNMCHDFDYAWGWYCNLKMTCMDITGCDLAVADAFAMDFMSKAFGVSTKGVTALVTHFSLPEDPSNF